MTTSTIAPSTSSTSPGMGVARRYLDLLAAGQIDAIGELYTPDVVFDANVPYWRFQLQGTEAITEVLHEGYGMPLRVASSRVISLGEWQIAEWEVHFHAHGEERLFREVHLLRLKEGRIAEQVVYCSGHWDEETIRRQAAEAPMVRRTDHEAATG